MHLEQNEKVKTNQLKEEIVHTTSSQLKEEIVHTTSSIWDKDSKNETDSDLSWYFNMTSY